MNKLISFSEEQISIIKMAMGKTGSIVFTEFVRTAVMEKAIKINKTK